MGSGKSTVGRLLAAQLAWHFVDLDAEIERATGSVISEIFEQQGEAVFREIEHECLTRVLGRASAQDARTVLALGGGTVAQPRNIELLRNFQSSQRPRICLLWLDCPIEQLFERCVLMGDRPLFRDEVGFRALYNERLPYYQQAEFRIESSGEPLRVVERILGLPLFDPAARLLASGTSPGPGSL